ncbi:MAG: lysine--tRNA ligase [Pseudomonadota bacterium]
MSDQHTGQAGLDTNKLIEERRRKLVDWRDSATAYPNDFRRDSLAGNLLARYDDVSKQELEDNPVQVAIAGRMMLRRVMGKASFANLTDRSGAIQIYLQRDALAEGVYTAFKGWDIGDILGVSGTLFRTNKGELTVKAHSIRLLTKSLRPLPEKWAGLSDQETRYRQRYVDLMINEDSRAVFRARSRIVTFIRVFLESRDFMEVETPMMQTTPGGAVARPFQTHHNALDMPLYLRVAPELNLKRLVVGGFERVYEINRNFRNEGLSTQHNPEFTMLELYQAYADYEDLINMLETLLRELAQALHRSAEITWQGETHDLSKPFERITIEQSIIDASDQLHADNVRDVEQLRALATELGIAVNAGYGAGKLQLEIFEKIVEPKLIAPTFVMQHPAEVSPLSRANDADPFLTDRFELFIGGREIANGFSELNDPDDQAARFQSQVDARGAGDDEAMHFDSDYIRALEYGLPPTAGLGVGIDRLVMMMTDRATIRDVLLFPHMRPEA